MVRGGDPDGVLDLLPGKPKHPTGDDRRDESGERGVVPTALADAREGRLAKAHLELVPQDDADDQLFSTGALTLGAGERRRDDVGRVRRILLPVDVVVVHHPDHQGVGERGRDDIRLPAAADHRRRALPADLVQHLERVARILLNVSTQRAADRVEQISARLVHRLLSDMIVLEAGAPT